jgi:O-antigen ligase/polysaccharide polymerase Wzy-like membrane protein
MRRPAVRGALLPAAAAALAFAALFLNQGSSESRLFWIGSAAVVVAAVGWALRPPQLSRPGLVFFTALGAFVIWQGLSISWSIQPARSWDYTNRGLVYFAFAAVGALLGGVPVRRIAQAAAVLLGALFVWALTAKVAPGLYEDYGRLARLRYPVGYWNELALLAAASVPLGLWLAGDRSNDRRVRTGGALLLYAALVVAVLTYSRVGIVLTVAAALAWLALDRDRLVSVAPLAVGWVLAAAVAGAALLLPGVSDNAQSDDARLQDGLVFGAVFVVGAAVVVFALRFVQERAVDRRLARRVTAGLAGLVVVALAIAVVRAGGPVDFVSDRWHEFSNPASAQVANTEGRFATVSSSNRWRWWQEAWNAFVDDPLQGTGAGTFGLTDRLERDTSLAVTEPHSAPLQDLTETGIVGFLLIVAALVAAAVAIWRRERTPAVIALALGAVACVVHSLVDIDWDYVAVQGPFFLTVGALVSGRAAPMPGRPWLRSAVIGLAALAVLYSLASPYFADRRVDKAYDALVRPDLARARAEAKAAHALNPLAVEPLWVWALTEPDEKALELYREARDLEPKNPETWYRLGLFELDVLKRPHDAYRDLNQSYTLDDYGPAGQKGGKLDEARCAVDPATCPE